MTRARPPRLARLLLHLSLPPDERAVVPGELLELFHARVRRDGARRARGWYRRQVAGFVLRARRARRIAPGGRRDRGAGAETDGASVRGSRRSAGPLAEVVADVRWAVRSLRRRPAFTAVAGATLALGIGANTAVFALASAHFLVPLPYERPDELVLLWETERGSEEVTTVAPGNYFAWRDEATAFADMAAFNIDFTTLSGDGPATRIDASVVAPHFFRLLGVDPALGRSFDEASVRAADGRLVILSHGLWTRRYGADPDIVGRDVRVDGAPHTVVGVMPAAYRQPERSLVWQRAELWRPLVLEGQRSDFSSRFLRVVARLRPDADVGLARQEMAAMAERMARVEPESNAGRRILVRELDDYLLGDGRAILGILLVAGGAVLLIVCANVANLVLARGTERRREFAVRTALGSGRARLVRQVLVEGVVLALVGAGAGALAVWGARGPLQALQARYFSGLVDVSVDARVLALTFGAAVAAGVAFGLPLALDASRGRIARALTGAGKASPGRGFGLVRNLLIVGQVAVATTLVAAALLLTRSFTAMVDVPPGFRVEDVATFQATPPADRYADAEALAAWARRLRAGLEAIPGVEAVGMASDLPFTTENVWTTLDVDGRGTAPEERPRVEYRVTDADYFAVMEIPVLAGALPADGDVPAVDPTDSTGTHEIPVAVNRRLARSFWPGEDSPLGRTLVPPWEPAVALRVVAVVGDVRDDGFAADAEPIFYLPWSARPRRRMSWVVRTSPGSARIAAPVREVVERVDADVPVGEVMALEEILASTVDRPRAASLIGGIFALLALLVAAAGIYGVQSYAVRSRTRELGIRSALGATGGDLVTMVLGRSASLLALGLAPGVLGALLAGVGLSGSLFGIPVWDPPSLALAVTTLGGVGLLAAWLPARQAVRVEPREALRTE